MDIIKVFGTNVRKYRTEKKIFIIVMLCLLVVFAFCSCSKNTPVVVNQNESDVDKQDETGIFDENTPGKDVSAKNLTKEDIFKNTVEEIGQESPSKYFASGAVFDIVRQNHDEFVNIVNSSDMTAIRKFFIEAYVTFINDPQVVGFTSSMVNKSKNDTEPAMWNVNIVPLSSNEVAVLCFMPVESNEYTARIFGIVLSDSGDRYYYCMLNKDENAFSDVMQNKALQGIEKVGEVKGLGFDLMNSFVECIKNN